MADPPIGDAVRDLHGDLARKYRIHGAKLDPVWRSLSQRLRAKAIKDGAADGVVLKHSLDPSMGNVYKFLPEWNLRDITQPESDFLLDLLKHRATTTLQEQYDSGFNGRPGDYEHIAEMMRTKNLKHVEQFPDSWTFFLDGDMYGKSYKILQGEEYGATLASFQPAIRAGVCIPRSVGELVLLRQLYLLQALNVMVEDILAVGSSTRVQQAPPKKSLDSGATTAMSKLSIQNPILKLDLPDLQKMAVEQKASLEDTLNLTCTEPIVLAHMVNYWFFSRPELIPDEKGRSLPAHTDKFISAAVLDAVHSTIKGVAIWRYMCRLLDLLESTKEKSHRAIVLQEISNACYLEYSRTQALFRRHSSTGIASKCFKRASNVVDNGSARISLKSKPEQFTREDPQLHYILRLCQPETNALKAVDWLMKLDNLHKAHPSDREVLTEGEIDALSDLAVIVGFIQSLCPAISMPAFSRKKGQLFVSGSADLDAELGQIKSQLDLLDYVVPIDNLLEPGVAQDAVRAMDQFIIEKAGTKLELLYEDLIEDCITKLGLQLKASNEPQSGEYTPLPLTSPESSDVRVQYRRQKEKTRSTRPSESWITPSTTIPVTDETVLQETFSVKPSTFEVFSTIFAKSESRTSVPWVRFEAAMADLGFSVSPKFGSVFTFNPPESRANQRPVTLHRPHKSRIEGYLILIFGRRLTRIYGWTAKSFKQA